MSDGTEVTAAAIARLAGVGRAAVSNWRRRYADFPRPVGGTETSPTFSLAQVESWLRDQGKLAEAPLRERVRRRLESAPEGYGPALVRAGEHLAGLNELPSGDPLDDARRELGLMAAQTGPAAAFEQLLADYFDANPRQYARTPQPTAALMARLAGPGEAVLDPACGSAELLLAASPDPKAPGPPGGAPSGGRAALHGQESDPLLARLAALRLTLRAAGTGRAGPPAVDVRTEDALRTEPAADAPQVTTVLCHPPFNERNWGHDELAYDPRWTYGLPARTDSELAWVQHALSRLRPGGIAVLLLPPAVAARRTGRRVRAALLRKGALRAVLALPPGAAAPHSLPLHLWVLRKPGGTPGAASRLLLMDAGGRAEDEEPPSWERTADAVVAAWRAHDAGRSVPEEPGVCATLPVIDLLDDEVDLSPARHLLPGGTGTDAVALASVRADLERTLRRTLELSGADASAPEGEQPPGPGGAALPEATVGELARSGALEVHTAGAEPVTTAPGDVVLPVTGRGAAHVVAEGEGGARLGKPLCLLRPDPTALDPWFVAGFLRSTANTRQASSYASSASRIDVRRLRLPRLPLERQRAYGDRFRRLAEFEAALRRVGELGEEFVQGMFDGLADGTVPPS
ncbi:N-6 DNA methylase [Streptomyces sp. 891-h]|uniref:N-6 DNA methylase n=1 Tax=unclassified Streptomyces TaxID=2593676 RepID=UPI001FA9797A|nr:N-6 DNA methylase [Streptomyces sp. 891-h]UNZ18954.1 N-6 DNA methylase [Streptomyces sp. 891-h]